MRDNTEGRQFNSAEEQSTGGHVLTAHIEPVLAWQQREHAANTHVLIILTCILTVICTTAYEGHCRIQKITGLGKRVISDKKTSEIYEIKFTNLQENNWIF